MLSSGQQKKLKVFVRQPFTESGADDVQLIQSVMDLLESFAPKYNLKFLVPMRALDADSFRRDFEHTNGVAFTPQRFREHRLSLLSEADLFVNIRVGLSESSAFEVAYNIFGGSQAPLFFAVSNSCPIKTTLLRELDDMVPATYEYFTRAEDLRLPLDSYFLAARHQADNPFSARHVMTVF